eukprot:scaffold55967_cov21-Prasinocladus_malaysianus.AAC.1
MEIRKTDSFKALLLPNERLPGLEGRACQRCRAESRQGEGHGRPEGLNEPEERSDRQTHRGACKQPEERKEVNRHELHHPNSCACEYVDQCVLWDAP